MIVSNTESDFKIHTIHDDIVSPTSLAGIFDALHCDKWIKEGYRFKSIFRAMIKNGEVKETEHGPLYQSARWNPTHGDIVRDYPLMKSEFRAMLYPLVKAFAESFNVMDGKEMLIQAQRITAQSGKSGLPTVEGWHQDGCKHLAIYLADRRNCAGGISQLSYNKGQDIVFSKALNPGEMLFVNDETLYHYVTPISQVEHDAHAWRDIVIITHPASRLEDA